MGWWWCGMVAFKTLTISGLKISNIVTCSGRGRWKSLRNDIPGKSLSDKGKTEQLGECVKLCSEGLGVNIPVPVVRGPWKVSCGKNAVSVCVTSFSFFTVGKNPLCVFVCVCVCVCVFERLMSYSFLLYHTQEPFFTGCVCCSLEDFRPPWN